MDNNIQQGEVMLSIIFGLYAFIPAVILIAGIITWITGNSKEKKNLKLAGIVITILGGKLLILIGLIYLYLKFIINLSI